MKKLIAVAVMLAFGSVAFAQDKKDESKGKRKEEKQRVEDKSKPIEVTKEGKRKEEKQRVEDKSKPLEVTKDGKRKDEAQRTDKK